MKSNNIYRPTSLKGLLLISLLTLTSSIGCKKYLQIPLPLSKTAGEGAYSTDRSSAATINNIFASLANSRYFDGGASSSMGYATGLYTDELQTLNPNNLTNTAFYSDLVNEGHTGAMWTGLYKQIYNANLAIEGITASTTLLHKEQWLGEAYFLRAFCYFYLTNYYGDAVLATSSDYIITKELGRSPKVEIYKQIVADLLKAQGYLTNEYKDAVSVTTINKGRPNKLTATALLARTYLYMGDWANAEVQANNVITGTIGTGVAYSLLPAADIDKVFLAASTETIFNLASASFNQDYAAYNNNMLASIGYNNLSWTGVAAAISPSLLSAFETNPITLADDRRKTYWLRSATMRASNDNPPAGVPPTPIVPAQFKYFPNKYKSGATAIGVENIILFRLAEQYLIRAEARARQNNLEGPTGAKADLDVIRLRAGLTATTATGQTNVIKAILQERRVELFSEIGHRFFDLKRTGTIDAVMDVETPAKVVGATWSSYKQNFPIPISDILANPKIIQTPGYQ